jgi:single-stranded DNA-binding protein
MPVSISLQTYGKSQRLKKKTNTGEQPPDVLYITIPRNSRRISMFFIRRENQYWTGKEWTDDYHQAVVYGSAAEAIANFPREGKKGCVAVGLNTKQWDELSPMFFG